MELSETEQQRYIRLMMMEGMGSNIKGQILIWEGAMTDFKKFKIRKDPDCPTCGGT